MSLKGQQTFHSRLTTLSKEDRFCDVEIEFSDGNRKFNSLVLAALSPYLEDLLSSSSSESHTRMLKISVVTVKQFETVLAHYMEGEAVLKQEAMYEAIEACEIMKLPDLKEVCIANMTVNLSPQNCVRIWQLSQKFSSDLLLSQKALALIHDNFEELQGQPEFLKLSLSEAMAVIQSCRQTRREEALVLESVLTWISYNRPDEEEAGKLLKEIRLELIQVAIVKTLRIQFQDVLNIYKSIAQITKEFVETEDFASEGKQSDLELHNVIVVCSSSLNSVLHVHAWHLDQKKWFDLSTNIPSPIEFFAATATGQKLVITGGKYIGKDISLSGTRIYNLLTNKWCQGPSLTERRCRHCSVGRDGSVYVIGGFKNVDSIESMTLGEDGWQKAGRLCVGVQDATVECSGRYIIVTGGETAKLELAFCGVFERIVPNLTVQCFNVESCETTIIKNFTEPVLRCSSSFSNSMYLFFLVNNKPLLKQYCVNVDVDAVELQRLRDITINEKLSVNSKTGFVIWDKKGFLFAESSAKEFDLNSANDRFDVLPTIPGNVRNVHCAFQSRISCACLHTICK